MTSVAPMPGAANQRHRLALLALLVAAPGNQLSRDRILAALWPDRDTVQARSLLNTAVHAVRKELGSDVIRSIGDALFLDGDLLDSDFARLQRFVAAGQPEAAVAEYSGPFLEGFHLPSSVSFDEWLTSRRAQVHTQVTHLLEQLVSGAGSPVLRLRWTERGVHHDPHSARAAIAHMRALVEAGDGTAAMRFAQVFQQRVREDLGAGPDPDVAAMEIELRAGTRASVAVPDSVPRDPPPRDPPPVRPPATLPARPRWIGRSTVGGVALGLGVAMLWAAKGGTPAPARASVVIMPFEVRGDAALQYLGPGLMDLLSARMNGMGPVTTVDPAALALFLGSEDHGDGPALTRASRAANALGGDRVVIGSVVGMGSRLEVRAAIHDAQGRRESEVHVAGEVAALSALVDDLARQLLAEQLRDVRGPIPSLAALTTDSLGALRAYLEGEEAFRSGELLVAADRFQRAVAIDATFALGYFRLGQVRNRLPGLQRPWWERTVDQQAVRFAERLPVFERELVRTGAMPNGEALPVLRQLVALRPSSAEAAYRLGVALDNDAAAHGTDNAAAIEALRRALVLDRGTPGARRALAFALARRGAFDEARRIAVDTATAASDALLARTLVAFGRGSAGEMHTVIGELSVAPPSAIEEAAAAVTTLTRRPDRARPIYALLAQPHHSDTVRWITHTRLADLALAEGRWREARRQVALADAVFGGRHLGKRARMAFLPWSPVRRSEADSVRAESLRWFLRGESPEGPERSIPGMAYNAGMISASRGDTAGIREAMLALDRLKGTVFANRLAHLQNSLEAEIAWIAHQPARTIDLLSNVVDPNANQRYRMAQALEAVGREEEALRWYQSYPDLDLNAPNQLGWWAASLLQIGDVYARQGDATRARTVREEFLRLWRDADAELQPMVDSLRRVVTASHR